MKSLYLFRGLPGAGKTTTVESFGIFIKNINWFEADFHFYENGVYIFDVSMLSFAHEKCKKGALNAMRLGKPQVAVSNTFTTEWEMEDYITAAKEFGYNVVSIIVENRHGNESVHGVPKETMAKMKSRFQVKL